MKESVEHFAEYWWPGFIVSEATEKKIKNRPKDEKKFAIPKGVFAYSFFDVKVISTGGNDFRSSHTNVSQIYVEGVKLSLADVEEDYPDSKILISNMTINHIDFVVHTKFGQFLPYQKSWVVLDNVRRTKE